MKKFLLALFFSVGVAFSASAHAAQDVVCDTNTVAKSSSNKASSRTQSSRPRSSRRARTSVRKSSRKSAQKISVPARATVYPLEVIAVAGLVEVEKNGAVSMVGVGERLYLNDILRTGKDSFTSVRLGDGTVNVLPPNSRIKLLQLDDHTARYDLLNGRIESRVTKSPNAKKSTFEIRVPTVSIGVRGTQFSVSYQADTGESSLEVVEGLVQVQKRYSCEAGISVAQGEGLLLNQRDLKVQPLLDAPQWATNDTAQRDELLAFVVTPVAGAVKYRAQIASDLAFTNLQLQKDSESPTVKFNRDGLKDGFYFVRLYSIDANGMQGKFRQYVFLRNRKTLGLLNDASIIPFR